MRALRTAAAFLLLVGLYLAGSTPALAAYPAPWPDSGSSDVNTGWTPYTYVGTAVMDKAGGIDQSTGGTTPQQYVDVVSDVSTRPSSYYAYDAVNQVFFYRFRLSTNAFNSNYGGNPADPLAAAQWNVLIDIDADGYREFIVSLDGRTGAQQTPVDDIKVFYGNDASNGFPTTVNWTAKAGIFTPTLDADARATVVDARASRAIDKAETGGSSYFLDFQVPMSAFVVGGQPLIAPTTSISLGWATANSNTDPFQKDAVYDGVFTPSTTGVFPFGDNLSASGGTTQDPYVLALTSNCTRPADLLQVNVRDTLQISGGVAVNTINNVKFYYLPDANGDGTPDSGATPILISTVTTPVAGRVDLFEYNWDTTTMPGGTYDLYAVATDNQGNTGTSPYSVCTFELLPMSIGGTGYVDADHDAQPGPTEVGPGVSGLYVKLIPVSGGNALAAAAVNVTTGSWLMGISPPAGNYYLRLDDNNTLSDTTAYRPSGWIGTQAPTQERSLAVGAVSITNQDFGLYHGSTLAGSVFLDNGSGGGTAHDGIKQAGEVGIPGVTVKLLNGATELFLATTSGDGTYRVYVPAASNGATLSVQETNLPSSTSVSGNPGTTGGTYTLATDRTTFSYNSATAAYTGVDFGDVGATLFLIDGQQQGEAGAVLFYPHRFLAGTAGSVTFAMARVSQPALPGWNSVLYRDTDADGVVDPGEAVVTGAIAVTAGQEVDLVLKEFIPPTAPEGGRDQVTVTASFQPTGTGQALALQRVDLTTVTGGASVSLKKAVDLASAISGQNLTYTITYLNQGTETLGTLVVHDRTPAYTTFVSASYGTLPGGLTGCTVAAPAVGGTGTLTWTFTGVLKPGLGGTVTFQVKVK